MFDQDLREEIGRLRVEEGRTIKSLSEEYGVSLGSVSRWCHEYQASPAPRVRQQKVAQLQAEVSSLREENERLRAEAQRARIEADVLKDVLRSIIPGADSVPIAM